MDLIRSTIKTLFYDYPPEAIASHILNTLSPAKEMYARTAEILKWRESTFTESETMILQDILRDEWLVDERVGFGLKDNYHPYESVFLCLQKCGDILINSHLKEPKVYFDNLLRWRDLTLLVGEELLVIPTISYTDSFSELKRDMLWNPVLGHDNIKINEILKNSLSETHSHLYASADIFSFNWIVLMNNPMILNVFSTEKNDKSRHYLLQRRQEYDPVNPHTDLNLSLREWIAVAADLRRQIYQLVYCSDDSELSEKEIKFLLSHTKDPLTDIENINNDIAVLKENAIPIPDTDFIFDYAILKSDAEKFDLKSPFMIHAGERTLLYKYFTGYFSGNKSFKRFAPQVFLYLLIKSKLRRELIHTNRLPGLYNFKEYQDFKNVFVSKTDKNVSELLKKMILKYAIQTSLGEKINNTLETRIMPDEAEKISFSDFNRAIYSNDLIISENQKNRVNFVVHFSKSQDPVKGRPDNQLRHKNLRDKLQNSMEAVFEAITGNDTNKPKIVGIDVTGNELNASPEVFSRLYSEAHNRGINNLTYHVGEDFYDVVFGLRMIDETLRFLKLNSGSRIGHALALGIDVGKYYARRHLSIIIPKQALLDNIVWMKYTALEGNIKLQPATEFFIEKEYYKLVEDIGYYKYYHSDSGRKVFPDSFEYWEMMQMRGYIDEEGNLMSTSEFRNKDTSLLYQYNRSSEVFFNGRKTMTCKISKPIVEDIISLQAYMMRKVERSGITIETNPTSNLLVGNFEKYSELPLFRFHTVGNTPGFKLSVTVNTDDKGIFATSLENEYSLIAIALHKEMDEQGNPKWNDKEIEDYLKQLVYYGSMSRFK